MYDAVLEDFEPQIEFNLGEFGACRCEYGMCECVSGRFGECRCEYGMCECVSGSLVRVGVNTGCVNVYQGVWCV